MRVLVAGWFSFEDGHATAGDLLSRDVACAWLEDAGYPYDVALAPPFSGGVDWRKIDPARYSHVTFVCGPFEDGELERAFLSRFAGCRAIGLNLSMPIPLDVWNPFDVLLERDSSAGSHPDLAFVSSQRRVPIVGVCLVEPHPGALVRVANSAIDRLLASTEVARVDIDTRLDSNSTGLRSPAEVESLIARMDVCVTTRLHGMVLALKNGIPVLAIDPIAGGAKIRRQAETIGWPAVHTVDALNDRALTEALAFCLTEAAREAARRCSARAVVILGQERYRVMAAVTGTAVTRRAASASDSRVRRVPSVAPPKGPLVSVVIRCHRSARFLAETVDSVLQQSCGPVEIIVVHDGSVDAVGRVTADYPAVRDVRHDARLPAAARNRGVQESRGEYVVLLEADDRLLPGALAAGLDHLLVDPTLAFVYGRSRRVTDYGVVVDDPPVCVDGDHYAALLRRNCIRTATVMYRREAVVAGGGFDAGLAGGDDYELHLRLARELPVHAHDEVVVEQRAWGDIGPAMLHELAILRLQRPHVETDDRRRVAYETGLVARQAACARALLRRAATHWRDHSADAFLRPWLAAWRLSPSLVLKETGHGLARCGRRRWTSLSNALISRVPGLRG